VQTARRQRSRTALIPSYDWNHTSGKQMRTVRQWKQSPLAGMEWLRDKASMIDAHVAAGAGVVNDRARIGGIERNLELLTNGSEQEVMQRLVAEREIDHGGAEAQSLRDRIRAGPRSELREELSQYAPTLNRGPAGVGRQGIGEYLSGLAMNHPAARVAGIYAPATALGIAGLSAAGQGLMGLIQRREEAVASLAELERAAGMMIEGKEDEIAEMARGRAG